MDPSLDQQLQDAVDAAKTWLAVVEYGMVAVVALLFVTVILLFVMLWQVLKLRDELPTKQQHNVYIQPEAPKLRAQSAQPAFSSEFKYNPDPGPGYDRTAAKRESREH